MASNVAAPPTPLSGVFPVLPTPFDAQGQPDLPGLRRLVRYLLACGVDGITYPGVASEVAQLSSEERLTLTALVIEEVAGRVPVIVGASSPQVGVAVAHAVGKRLAAERLQHTRIVVVSFGSEETGLKGSGAFVKHYREQLEATPHFLINLDGMLDIDNMFIIKAEPSIPASHDKRVIAKVSAAFVRNGLEPKLGTIPVGATDASSFSRNGLSAMSIVGLPMDRLHPTYHTRLDTIDCLTPATMDRMVDILVDLAKDWDAND
jgi:hypothetical protein